jgi:hypothetical protein
VYRVGVSFEKLVDLILGGSVSEPSNLNGRDAQRLRNLMFLSPPRSSGTNLRT